MLLSIIVPIERFFKCLSDPCSDCNYKVAKLSSFLACRVVQKWAYLRHVNNGSSIKPFKCPPLSSSSAVESSCTNVNPALGVYCVVSSFQVVYTSIPAIRFLASAALHPFFLSWYTNQSWKVSPTRVIPNPLPSLVPTGAFARYSRLQATMLVNLMLYQSEIFPIKASQAVIYSLKASLWGITTSSDSIGNYVFYSFCTGCLSNYSSLSAET